MFPIVLAQPISKKRQKTLFDPVTDSTLQPQSMDDWVRARTAEKASRVNRVNPSDTTRHTFFCHFYWIFNVCQHLVRLKVSVGLEIRKRENKCLNYYLK
jgi:hypothetical protein